VGFEFEALGELVLDLELGAEDVGGCPGVREDRSVFIVLVFRLEVAGDVSVLALTGSIDTEGDVGGRLGLDFEPNRMEREVLAEQVARAFSEVLFGW